MGKTIQLDYQKVSRWAFAYMLLPVVVFLLALLRWYAALPALFLLGFAAWWALRKPNADLMHRRAVPFSPVSLLLIAGTVLLWTFLGGMNGFLYQNSDWPWRNAIFHDLINYRWPVVYPETGSTITYYIGFWMPPALVGKVAGWLTGSSEIAWIAGKNALWVWTSLGLFLTVVLLMIYLRAATPRKKLLAVLVFVFFSGLDIIGALCTGRLQYVLSGAAYHLEWWTVNGDQYSSMTTCVYWVFNQVIVPWLTVLCFLFEQDARNYLILGICCICCGPFPFVGLVICMIVREAGRLVSSARAHRLGQALRQTFSPPNLILLLCIFPALGLYFLTNPAFESLGKTTSQADSLLQTLFGYLTPYELLFLLLDAGIYLILLWGRHRREPLYYGILVSLLVIPRFVIGSSRDFCMRASIPAIFILMVWSAEVIVGDFGRWTTLRRGARLRYATLTAALLIGACTPALEINRAILQAAVHGNPALENDYMKTLAHRDSAGNFVSGTYPSSVFFKYLSRLDSKATIAYDVGFYDWEEYADEAGAPEETFRWCKQISGITVYVRDDMDVVLQFRAGNVEDLSEPFTLTVNVENNGPTDYRIEEQYQVVEVPVTLKAGSNWVAFTSDREKYDGTSYGRDLYFSLSGIRVLDTDGNLLVGAAYPGTRARGLESFADAEEAAELPPDELTTEEGTEETS